MESNVYNLTNPQKSIWFTEQFYKGTPIENITGCVIVLEKLNLKALQKAINLFVKSNDSFRLKFTVKDDKPLQYLSSFSEFEIENVMVNTDEDIKDIENEMSNTPFEVLDNLLFSFKTFTFPDGHGGFVITAHHLISDAWTAGLVVNEIMDYYEKIINSQIIDNKNPSYLDYITSEQEYLNSEKFNKDKEFWNEIFKTVPEVATIPSINVENSNSSLSCKAKRKQFVIPKETMNLINEFCKQNKASAFNFFMAVLAIYLSRVSSLDDFTIGTPILNRGNFKEKQTTGMYISTIPFRISINHKISFAEFLSNISADFSKIFRHQKYPYQYLLEDLRKKDSSIPNLYNILLSYQNVRSNKQTSDINYESSWVGNNFISDDIDIHLYDMNDTGDINIAYDYLISKYSIDDICSIHARFLYIINQVLENNDITLNEIEIVTPDEKKKILYDFNNTSADYPRDKTITQLFEEQVEKTPDNIAVVFEDQKLTYRELNERANSLASYLRSQKIGRNDIVGIMVNRSLEMIISILAVLKSGAAYLPIDPTYPKSRITYMINDSSLKLLLTQNSVKEHFNDLPNSLPIDLVNNTIYSNPCTNLDVINSCNDLAYVIYTSGSTGKPKGVMITQKNVNNFIQGTFNTINFRDTIVSVTTMCFDIFVLESLLPLVKGLKVVIATEKEQNIPKFLNKLCIDNNVKMLQTTPSRMALLLSDPTNLDFIKNLSVIMLGGEPFPYKLLQELKNITNSEIYNMYGPTETTVWSSIKNLSQINSINIGKPIANTQMYILDKFLNVLPIGVPGELYIGGDGVSNGYLGRTKLTSEKFIVNKFIENDTIYNTGDIAKWLPNGEIDCLGRVDSQVKLRGLRIELGEIEKQILTFPNIDNVAVCIKTDSSERQLLCGYFTSKFKISTSELKNYLSKVLPAYMVPAFLTQLEFFKYTPNGKIDKNSLPAPSIVINDNIILPETETESLLLKIWENLLSISPISIDENFFNIGGDSILALKMQIELLNHNLNISYADIFKYNTIKSLALRIDTIDSAKNSPQEYYESYDFTNINQVLENNNLTNATKVHNSQIGNVLLTGATGFLGAHILDYILSNTDSSVYCIVRKDSNNSTNTTDKLMSKLHYYFNNKHDNLLNKRLFIITSDITVDNLALTNEQEESLANNISCVINSAAIVKHYGYYSEFEKINVTGVKNLITFCKKFNKKLIQISTISVSGNTLTDLGIQENTFEKDINFTEKNLYIGQPLNNVYIRSKFEAERLILESIYNHTLDALILRVGNITSRSLDGKFQPNSSENAFLNRLKAFIEIGAVPDYILDNYAEFSPVDNLAKAIVKSIENVSPLINVLHIYNSNHIYISDLLKMIPDNLIKVVSNEDFKNILNKDLQMSENKDTISHITNDLNKNKELVYSSNIKIKNEISKAFFDKIHFEWDKIDKKYIENLLNIL